jgi:polyphosphate kinase
MSLNTKKYYNRDLSWLRFNHRVLQEVNDKRNPLYERIKFLAIFSSNLDEFFKVRVSAIRQIKSLEKGLRKKLMTKPNMLLKEIKKQVDIQQDEFGSVFRKSILPDLKKEGIYLINSEEYSDSQKEFVEHYFEENLKNKLTLKIVKEQQNNMFFVENEQLYLVSLLKNEESVIVKIPLNSERFVMLPNDEDTYFITFVDDILKYNLTKFYKSKFYALKVSRDAELYIGNEYSGNLLNKIKESLPKRDLGQVTRVLLDSKIPQKLLTFIKEMLDVNETDIILGGVYHNFKDFFSFPNPSKNRLLFEELPPIRKQEIMKFDTIFDAIKVKDRLLHFPYESFDPVIHLIEEAGRDKSVKNIKITLYRIAEDSRIIHALLKACENGINVTVFMETKARFDELNNMKLGSLLEANGAKVIYSYPKIKVHSKILLIEYQEDVETKAYGYIGTGNFNEKTAKIYTDFGLMTANKKITSDLWKVFELLERRILIPKTKELIVSPFSIRKYFKERIAIEIENALAGKEAYIILKLNNIQDPEMIELLYQANNFGVKIKLIIRGICCLVPNIIGQSENIKVISIVDRFLEHGRVYIFANGGDEKMYIGSGDWMTRNFDHRVEVITPILDTDIHKKIKMIIQFQLDDNVKSRAIKADQDNFYVSSFKGEIQSQISTYKKLLSTNEIIE